MAKKVKAGDKIIVDGVEYRIGEISAEAINVWLELGVVFVDCSFLFVKNRYFCYYNKNDY